MADFSSLKQTIQAYIKQNGNEEITGNILQDVLLAMVSTMGDSAINALASALQDETTTRQNQDATLQGNITAETTARRDADTALGGRIDGLQTAINGINTKLAEGCIYAGIATPSTNPGIINGKVFYVAVQAGTYTNFSNLTVAQGINILKYNGSSWSKDVVYAIDARPKKNSQNFVISGGVFDNIGALDVSELNATENPHTLAQYADLSAALAAIPTDYQKGGMSIKYVQTSDNKYVQYRLMSDTFSTTESDWQGVDDEPTAGSDNLVKSGGVFDAQAQFNVSDNGNVNKIIKELYLPNISIEQITKVRFFNCVNLGGYYFVGIQFTDNSYTEIASLRKTFSTLAEAQNARKTLFNNGNNYAVIAWDVMPEQTDYTASISANCLTLDYSPTIYSLLKDNEIKSSISQLSTNIIDIDKKTNKFVFTDNADVNAFLKEVYVHGINISNIKIIRVFKSANIGGTYYTGIILTDSAYNPIVNFRESFSTKSEADAYIKSLYETDGNYVVIDWESIPDGFTKGFDINLSSKSVDYNYSPTIFSILEDKGIIELIKNSNNTISTLVGSQYEFIDGNVWYNDNGTIKPLSANDRCILPKIGVSVGDTFRIETYLNTSFVPGWFLADADMNIISSSELDTESAIKKHIYNIVVNDSDAKYLCVSCTVANKDKFVCFNTASYLAKSIQGNVDLKKVLPEIHYIDLLKTKCPNTFNHIKNKDKDVTVVLTGTSLTQGNLYVTERADETKRPPCLFGNDLASAIYDKLIPFYHGQESRSYEHSDLTYSGDWNVINVYGRITIASTASSNGKIAVKGTEADVTTSMSISDIVNSLYNALLTNHPSDWVLVKGSDYVDIGFNDIANYIPFGARDTGVEMILYYPWDDNNKNGRTNTSTSNNASVSFTIPDKAKMFNFIYRSSFDGGTCNVSIAQGNGVTEVFNGTSWVEANGYSFSMFEAAPTGTEVAGTKTKGNTCYQKRLKMRCVSNEGSKTITITRTNGRMNVVGIEWTQRNVFLYVINGARGGHQWGIRQDNNLEQFQDSDIWEFAPDLILAEITIKNWGGERPKYDPQYFINLTKQAYFNEFNDDARSLYAKSNGYTDCEIIMYNSFLGGGITEGGINITYNSDGSYKLDLVSQATQQDSPFVGQIKDAWENYDVIDSFMASKDICYIPCNRWFERVADKVFENYFEAFQGSGASGDTISCDGTHLNDKGVLIWSACIAPIFDI